MKVLKIKNEGETIKEAAKFARSLKGGEIVALYGDLGAGKTQWVKGMCEGLGFRGQVTSPTFVLMNCFNLKSQTSNLKTFCHVDAYRLKSSQELLGIGIEDYMGAQDTVTVIEWAERAEDILKGKNVIRIKFNFGKKESDRTIEIS